MLEEVPQTTRPRKLRSVKPHLPQEKKTNEVVGLERKAVPHHHVDRSSFSLPVIYYDFDKSALRVESTYALDVLENFLFNYSDLTVEIYSYADAKEGSDVYAFALSQRRTQAAMDYLEKAGIDRGRITGRAFGNKNAAAPNAINGNDNPQGRQMNRRTEIRLVTDVPTKRVIYNSALPGNLGQQMRNLTIEDD